MKFNEKKLMRSQFGWHLRLCERPGEVELRKHIHQTQAYFQQSPWTVHANLFLDTPVSLKLEHKTHNENTRAIAGDHPCLLTLGTIEKS